MQGVLTERPKPVSTTLAIVLIFLGAIIAGATTVCGSGCDQGDNVSSDLHGH